MSLQTGEGDGDKILKFSEETTTVSATSVDGAPPKMHVLYRDFCLAHTMCHPKGLGCKRHEHKLKSLRTNLEKKRDSVKHNDTGRRTHRSLWRRDTRPSTNSEKARRPGNEIGKREEGTKPKCVRWASRTTH